MSDQPSPAPGSSAPSSLPTASNATPYALVLATALAVAGLVSSALLWQKLNNIQEQLARQSADNAVLAAQAREAARLAEDLSRDTAARLTVTETRVGEVALQRSQLEELMQSLSRSRDENLVVDIESGLRLAQQQAQLTGSLEPLVAALKSAHQRIDRAAQPRLTPVQRALERDLDRVTRASVIDTAGLLGQLDDLTRRVDDLPTLNAVAQSAQMRRSTPATAAGSEAGTGTSTTASLPWWQAQARHAWDIVHSEVRALVRVGRIDQPEAVLLSPDQEFFLRENLKLKLLNARMAVLARQFDAARTDLTGTGAALNKYFDPSSRRTQSFATVLQQTQAHLKTSELPRLEEAFVSLATAAAGR